MQGGQGKTAFSAAGKPDRNAAQRGENSERNLFTPSSEGVLCGTKVYLIKKNKKKPNNNSNIVVCAQVSHL